MMTSMNYLDRERGGWGRGEGGGVSSRSIDPLNSMIYDLNDL